jgi:hypothetical protein
MEIFGILLVILLTTILLTIVYMVLTFCIDCFAERIITVRDEEIINEILTRNEHRQKLVT